MRLRARLRRRAAPLAALALAAACSAGGPYFGRTTPPRERRLVFNNGAEPESLDPARLTSGFAFQIVDALFEGLAKYHPQTLEPVAALATHYETNADSTRFRFYLRGHPSPRGTKLPDTGTLTEEYRTGRASDDFTRGLAAPPAGVAALWSDGTPVTARDFVYSWRRAVDPKTASGYASLVYYVRNAEEINSGAVRFRDRATAAFVKDPESGAELAATTAQIESDPRLRAVAAAAEAVPYAPEDLAVRAPDDFTFEVDLRAPAAFFPKLLPLPVLAAVPRQAIEAAERRGLESSWTRPEHIVTNGAFRLERWRPYDEIVVVKNPTYYEADLVALDTIALLPTVEQTTNVNLYKAGEVDAMTSAWIPQAFIPLLRGKADFHVSPALKTYFLRINTTRPPFGDVAVRYALNMATDKRAVADFLEAGQLPALGAVPPLPGYDPPAALPVRAGGATYDVLAYDPAGARALLAHAGFPGGVGPDGRRLEVELVTASEDRERQIAEVVQQQLQDNLGVLVTLRAQEFKVHLQARNTMSYNGLHQLNWVGDYVDPNTFLDVFQSGSANNGTGWRDPGYDAMLAEANATVDPSERSRKLAACEARLLAGMPAVPLFFDANFALTKPYVRGLVVNLNDLHSLKYVWIDGDWAPGRGAAVAR